MYTMSTSILMVSVSDAKFKFGVCFRVFTEQASQKMSTQVILWFVVIVPAYTLSKYEETDYITYHQSEYKERNVTFWGKKYKKMVACTEDWWQQNQRNPSMSMVMVLIV